MAYLPEAAQWAPGVYQIEEEDDVLSIIEEEDDSLGEIDAEHLGPDNKPHKDLADRFRYLKSIIGTVIPEEE
jgi:hypothetical protein